MHVYPSVLLRVARLLDSAFVVHTLEEHLFDDHWVHMMDGRHVMARRGDPESLDVNACVRAMIEERSGFRYLCRITVSREALMEDDRL